MFPLKYWFKIFRILFSLSINEDRGPQNPKRTKENNPPRTTSPIIVPTRTTPFTKPSSPVTTTVTTTSLALEYPPPTITTSTVLTPSAHDGRVGWIYNLHKADLQSEMQKFNLDTSGTVEELRKRFRDFMRHGFTVAVPQDSGEVREQNPYNLSPPQQHTFLDNAGFRDTEIFNPQPSGLREVESVREMLGLPPNTDFKDVQRALSLLLIKDHDDRDPLPAPLTMGLETYTTQSVLKPSMSTCQQDMGDKTDNRIFKSSSDSGNLCNQIRKWNLRFDGNKDPVSFLERLNELMEAYEIKHDTLVKALPELFKGQALYWYRNNKASWKTYQDFIHDFEEYFLPPDYRKNLEEEILRRTQGENEPFRNFVVALQMLMRRQGTYSTNDLLNRLFRNMRPEYKLTIRREQFQTVNELLKLAECYESYVREKRNFRPPPAPAQSLFPEAAFCARTRQTRYPEVNSIDTTRQHDVSYIEPTTPYHNISYNKSENFQNKDFHSQKDSNHRMSKPVVQTFRKPQDNRKPQDSRLPTCWNCEKIGHRFHECRQPKVVRCYNCKTPGIRTVHCPCVQGNGNRDQRKGGALSLETTKIEQPLVNGENGLKK